MSELSDWLRKLGLERYISVFEENGIDARALPYLTEEDLKELQVLLGHRRIMLAAIETLESALYESESSPGDTEQAKTADEQMQAERRQVTILFADLAGYTRLSNELDAEEVHHILGCFFDSADAIIREHGGTIDKHLGDCVMAVFGAPVAQGNDPLHAVQAAYNIQASMPEISLQAGHKLEVHIGIASGQVVASGVGKDAHYTVTGDSVNLASRLADVAKSGETFISRQVQLSVSNHFLLGDGGELSVKGFEDPLQVYVLKGEHASTHQIAQRPFVGRQAELQQISGLLETCVSSGAGQVVYVRGEAGIGKTRVTEKVADIARRAGYACHRVLVLDFGMSRDQNVIRTLLSSLLGIAPDAEIELKRRAVDQAVESNLLEASQRLFLNEMLGIEQAKNLRALYDAMDVTTRQQGKLAMMSDLISALSRGQPQFILVEDIHWAGKSVLSYITQIASTMVDSPFLLLMTSRFEGDPLHSHWQAIMGATLFATIDLKPLRHRDAMSLAADYFDASKQFALDCVARADGNPLFLEQLLRNAEEAGENQVPGSVQSIVQARLDVIHGEDKNAIQAASVLGKRFFLNDLRHLIDEPDYVVTHLIERQLIKPDMDGRAFLFSHALVQEAVYQSLLKNKRVELHRHAADLYAEAEPELCARHLDRAGDVAASAAYLRAAKLHYNEQQFEPALELLELGLGGVESEEVRYDLLCLKGDVLRWLGQVETSIDVFRRVLGTVPGEQRECRARISLAEGLRIVDRQKEALSVLDRAQQLAQSLQLKYERGYIHYLRGNLNFMLGNIDTCLDEHQMALLCSDESGSQTGKALAFGGLGDAYYLRGHMRSALDQFQACGQICQAQGYGKIEVTNRHMAGWCRIYLMDYVAAREDALVAIEMAAGVKQQRAEVLGLKLAGTVEIEMGMFDSALVHLSRAQNIAQQLQSGNFEAQALALLARLHAASGDVTTALARVAEAEAIVRKVGMAFIGPIVLAIRAELSSDRQVQETYIKEAELLLDAGCVSHNHFWVARSAIEINLQRQNWLEVERIAQRLERYTAGQPLDWSNFVIARGRALASWEQGDHGAKMRDHLQTLSVQAATVKMVQFRRAIEAALTSAH